MARRHVEVVVRGDRLVGFSCLGTPQVSASLSVAFDRRTPVPADPVSLLVAQTGPRETRAPSVEASPTLIPADATICRCNGVTKSDIMGAWDEGCHELQDGCRSDEGHHRVRWLHRDRVRPGRLAHGERQRG